MSCNSCNSGSSGIFAYGSNWWWVLILIAALVLLNGNGGCGCGNGLSNKDFAVQSAFQMSKMIKDLGLPPECLITLIVRDNDSVVAKGDTVIKAGDEVVLCARSYQNMSSENLIRHPLSENSKWTGHKVSEYPYANGSLLVMIERGDDRIIPTGDTVLKKGDILVILKNKQL